MDFKTPPRPPRPTARRRVTLQDYTERPLRASTAPAYATPGQSMRPRTMDGMLSQTPATPLQMPRLVVATVPQSISVLSAQPYASPARPKLQQSRVLARRTAVPATQSSTEKPARRRRSKAQIVLVSMAALVFGLGLLVNIETLQANHDTKTQVSALSSKADTSSGESDDAVPSETKPSGSTSTYNTAPDLPKLIQISKIGVNARVRPVGVTTSNALGTPSNIHDTGWYNASAKPGDGPGSGAMLIDGHVHGPSLPGVFVDIKKLTEGDTITVTRGDNQVFSYSVVKTAIYPADSLDVGLLLTSAQPGKQALNLITCGGKFDSKTQHYEDRTVVFAVLQS
ncbi:MAG: class F sortase [Candidatus Saccharimonadales bacterium]